MDTSSKENALLYFSPIFFPDLNEYKKTLPRRKHQRSKDGCCGFSTISWVFLCLALFQVALVTGFQVAITILGSGRLENYVGCLEASLKDMFMAPVKLENSSLPTFGQDKEIYVFFFISLVVYNFFLVAYALKFQNIVEVYSFMVINILTMVYASFQVYQFRGFGVFCGAITLVGYLALGNALLLLVFTIVFFFLSLFIYAEFGWKTYVLVDGNPAMRYYYRVHQVFMSVLKLVILFLVIFSIGQCVLILRPSNYEFPITILIAIAAILATPVIYFLVTIESILGAIAIIFCGVALVAYFVFKTYRYATRSCPLCIRQSNQTIEMRNDLKMRILIANPNASFIEDLLNLDSLNRAEDFGHLIMIAVINMIFTLVAILVFVHYLRQYNKGLKDYFAEKNRNFYRLLCCCCRRKKFNSKSNTTQHSLPN